MVGAKNVVSADVYRDCVSKKNVHTRFMFIICTLPVCTLYHFSCYC
jgi:hypothetical protein